MSRRTVVPCPAAGRRSRARRGHYERQGGRVVPASLPARRGAGERWATASRPLRPTRRRFSRTARHRRRRLRFQGRGRRARGGDRRLRPGRPQPRRRTSPFADTIHRQAPALRARRPPVETGRRARRDQERRTTARTRRCSGCATAQHLPRCGACCAWSQQERRLALRHRRLRPVPLRQRQQHLGERLVENRFARLDHRLVEALGVRAAMRCEWTLQMQSSGPL